LKKLGLINCQLWGSIELWIRKGILVDLCKVEGSGRWKKEFKHEELAGKEQLK
jgi:hypothetical protein